MMLFKLYALLSKHTRPRQREHGPTSILVKSWFSTMMRHAECSDVTMYQARAKGPAPTQFPTLCCKHAILCLTHNYSNQTVFSPGHRPTCWKCGKTSETPRPSLFCKKCNMLQKPDLKMNYFDLIGVEQKYDINVNEVTTKYRKLQNILHPDRFSNRDKEEIMISEDYSALLNQAYTTLLHPLLRGQYMLQLKGICIENGTVKSSPKFLMKIMEMNEEIDEAQHAEQIQLLEAQNKSSMDKLAMKVGEALATGDLKRAEEILVEMKYYASMGAKLKDLIQKMGL